MSERLVENHYRIEFETLNPGDELTIKTGLEADTWNYDFKVENTEHWPTGKLKAMSPTGTVSEPMDFEIHGCGQWTNRRQNPVQTQELAFTPYYEGLIVGSFMWGRFVGDEDRVVFDAKGQEISSLSRTPYRENAILRALSEEDDALSVKQITEAIKGETPKIIDREVRLALSGLVKTGRVATYRRNVFLFKLANK